MRKTPGRTRLTPRLRAVFVAVAIAAVSGTTLAGSPASAAAPRMDTTQFKGVNWADPRDNFADDPVVLSGLSLSDTYRQTYAKATRIISAFRANLGANTVRLPINPYTVNGSYWKSYRGVIDAASDQGSRSSCYGRAGRPEGRLTSARSTVSPLAGMRARRVAMSPATVSYGPSGAVSPMPVSWSRRTPPSASTPRGPQPWRGREAGRAVRGGRVRRGPRRRPPRRCPPWSPRPRYRRTRR
ncbi:hypothetical protein SALBM311S_03280 [Streptomyces alboniger]